MKYDNILAFLSGEISRSEKDVVVEDYPEFHAPNAFSKEIFWEPLDKKEWPNNHLPNLCLASCDILIAMRHEKRVGAAMLYVSCLYMFCFAKTESGIDLFEDSLDCANECLRKLARPKADEYYKDFMLGLTVITAGCNTPRLKKLLRRQLG